MHTTPHGLMQRRSRGHHRHGWIAIAAACVIALVLITFWAIGRSTIQDGTGADRAHENAGKDVATRLPLGAITPVIDGKGQPEQGGTAQHGVFRGGPPWRTKKTIAAKLLLETPWIRMEEHTVAVRSPSGATHHVTDWKWIDVSDQVNVLVSITLETLYQYRQLIRGSPTGVGGGARRGVTLLRAASEPEEPMLANTTEVFMLFEQEKYGYEGLSFAVVGGLVEANEEPLAAAEREVHEELGFAQCTSILALGKFRTDVNRGGGFVSSFLARQCQLDVPQVSKQQQDRSNSDLERQTPVAMTREFLKELLLTRTSEAVKEVKWCNTIAMSLLIMDSGIEAAPPTSMH